MQLPGVLSTDLVKPTVTGVTETRTYNAVIRLKINGYVLLRKDNGGMGIDWHCLSNNLLSNSCDIIYAYIMIGIEGWPGKA